MKQKLIDLQEEVDKSTNIVTEFNIHLLLADGTSRQKIGKDIEDLNNTHNLTSLLFPNAPPNNSGIHTLFRCTQNIYEDQLYSEP